MIKIIGPSQGKNFDVIVKKKPCIAKFHRPNCPHCIDLEPIWKKVFHSPIISNLNTTFLDVHSGAIQNITSKCAENIVGVPTIMIIYNNGKSRKLHTGANDFDSIIKFITGNKQLFMQNGGSVRRRNTHRRNTRRRNTRRRNTRRRNTRRKQIRRK